MNPFDLRGPEFVLFYMIFSICIIIGLFFLRRSLESGPTPKLGDIDPYMIAYLRGGSNEALRVATISLLDRGLLVANGELIVSRPDAQHYVRRPIEQSILRNFILPSTGSAIFSNSIFHVEFEHFETQLRNMKLIPDSKQIKIRVQIGFTALVILWCIAYAKIHIALSHHRHNIGFLILCAIANLVAVVWVLKSRRTPIGDRIVADLKTLFSGLHQRSSELQLSGATNELTLLIGIYGLGALSGTLFSQAKVLFPQSTNQGDSSSCGNSCGSSCGSGGCGGGCGGCGGD